MHILVEVDMQKQQKHAWKESCMDTRLVMQEWEVEFEL